MSDRTTKVEMHKQDPKERIRNFNEVASGYSAREAVEEAKRCLQCKKSPCVKGCPVEIDIPAFIKCIQEGNFKASIDKIKEKNNLPAVCGRVCPQESQCEIKCVKSKKGESVAIGRLERFAADWEMNESAPNRCGTSSSSAIKVAVVGSGPAGLTAAADLVKLGYEVTVFEALHSSGGVLRYGIPEFRLPKSVLEVEISNIEKLGVRIQPNVLIGKTLTIDDLLKQGFSAIFIGIGAGLPHFLNIPGENLDGVYSASEFLTRVNLMKAYQFPQYDTPVKIGRRVGVIGGGNVAMDSARVALRLGAEEVNIIYRRSKKEMPARQEEAENAEEEGVKFHFLTAPLAFLGNKENQLTRVKCIQMKLGKPDESGRRRPIPVKGSEFIMDIDTVVVAIGQGANPLLAQTTPDLKLNNRGYIQINEETGQSSIPQIFAGGDIVTGAATVIAAMGAGKKAARGMDEYLKS
ncbi:MAG: NADPH-dependent glutamate synthase [Clostridia bacterium]|nr:NADPH-dependent glutamate synthase [Clostridia bacterium]